MADHGRKVSVTSESSAESDSENEEGCVTFSRQVSREDSKCCPLLEAPKCDWRGCGGGVPTLSSVEFDRQLDKISMWLEQWGHRERCQILEILINRCQLHQFQLLWTVLQPALHRDFMYSAKKVFPNLKFMPISTHTSRELKRKMNIFKTCNYHRINSAHLEHYEQMNDVMSEVDFKLPNIKKALAIGSAHQSPRGSSSPRVEPDFTKRSYSVGCIFPSTPSPFRSAIKGTLAEVKSHTDAGVNALIFDGEKDNCLDLIQYAPACVRFLEMPVRRHLQTPEPSNGLSHGPNFLCIPSNDGSRSNNSSAATPRSVGATVDDLSPNGAQVVDWFCNHWNDSQRNEFLHKFLLKLDPRQHYFISSLIAVKRSQDFLRLLPEKIALKILSYLTAKEILHISRVSKAWYRLCNNNDLWKIKCAELRVDKIKVGKHPNWKTVYRENCFIKRNWRRGKCKTLEIKGHTDKVLAVSCDEERIVTGSADHSVRVWSIKDGRCLNVLNGHLRGVWCLSIFTKNLVISGSYDTTIKIWNLHENSCMRTLLGHQGAVWSVARRGSTLVSASQDKTAKIWDISRCLLQHTLIGHTAAIFSVDIEENNQIVVTGSADRSVRLWSVQAGALLRVIWASQESSIMSVSYSGNHMACCYGNCVKVYRIFIQGDVNEPSGKVTIKYKLFRSYEEHEKRIESVALNMETGSKSRGTLISSGKDGLIKQYDLGRSSSIQTYSGHTRTVNCVHCDARRIISASYDYKVKIWDFSGV